MTIHQEFQLECQSFAARVALEAAENLTVSKRLMLYQGILPLLQEGSDARLHAQGAIRALRHADKSQLCLKEIIQNS